ncbi:2-dehydropantoate 2-reductase [Deinococcus cavernae]|uniref:2-dehydropantoate 2-reductase n=1 Tax=Deinococcus cavernae TaxID=2320857 RepID=A0A418VGR1_9DEIO|nr:2-dehydropantoate 2-reductase [Deinococcus cavernae]RJF75284.1 2-dehydropantoate 2-reductase [Deinococcus cavernae]
MTAPLSGEGAASQGPSRVLIWGAGAIGGTLGAYLARAGHDVTLVDREAAHVQAIREGGLSLTGPIEEFRVSPPAFTPDEVQGQWPLALLCTKAQHTREAGEALLPHVAPDGHVISVQNGLNPLILNDLFGEARVLGSFVNFGADYLEPGVIHFGGRGAMVVGEQNGEKSERAGEVQRLLQDFEPQALLSDNVMGFLWGKLGYGGLLFATALTNDGIADALERTEDQAIYRALGREAMQVAAAHGVRPEGFNGFDPQAFSPAGSDEQVARSLADMVAFNRRSAKTHSGIWRDLAVRKRRTEVDAQMGWVAHFGEQHGVPTPVTGKVIQMVHEIEEGRRPLGHANLEELAAFLAGASGTEGP